MFVKLYEVLAQGRRGYSIQYNPAMRDCCAGVVLAFRASQAALNSAFAVSRSLAEPMGSPPGRWTLTAQSQTRRYKPPVRMIKLTEQREITPYKWVHPDEER